MMEYKFFDVAKKAARVFSSVILVIALIWALFAAIFVVIIVPVAAIEKRALEKVTGERMSLWNYIWTHDRYRVLVKQEEGK